METFDHFLKDRWLKRAARTRVLCLYDAPGRYREIAMAMADAKTQVIDATADVIGSREAALDAWRKVAEDVTQSHLLVIYLQRPRPLDEEGLREDPFTPFVLGGSVFPDGAGDEYRALCEQFLPDQKGALDELFAQGEPAIALVNALVSGKESYPALANLLTAGGAREILVRFLCLKPAEKKKMKADPHWLAELKALVAKTLGLQLHGAAGEVAELQRQIWRYVLFSEFAMDLPGGLPPALMAVPRATARHERFATDLCGMLRDYVPAQQAYEEAATETAGQLKLEQHCAAIEDLGRLDTFAFEERSFLRHFAKALQQDRFDSAEELLKERSKSFWIREAERAAQWKLAACCLELRRKLSDLRAAAEHRATSGVAECVAFYATEFFRADALQRELEQVAHEAGTDGSPLQESLAKAREEYREAIDRLARRFQAAVEKEGWPAAGIPRATETFERFVRQPWQQGKRVAYLWVDALRYELAEALANRLAARHRPALQPVCAQLPTVTRIGMAALLPGAETDLKLTVSGEDVVPAIKGQPVLTVTDRFKLLQEFVGPQRCRLLDLEALTAPEFSVDLGGVEVLVVKNSDIDLQGENNAPYFIRVLPAVLRKIEMALNRLAAAGFELAVVTADHGFCWFPDASAGSSISKPPGEWVQVKERSLLGSGQPTADTLLVDAAHAGIRGEPTQYVAARGMATFSKGVQYFHEGLSLQECVIPLLQVELRADKPPTAAVPVKLVLTYRGASTGKVTTLRPSVEVAYPAGDLFTAAEVRFLLEAFDPSGKPVAEAAASPCVDAGTGEVTIEQGRAIKVPLKIADGFEGELEVRATNRETGEIYGHLALTTDFHH